MPNITVLDAFAAQQVVQTLPAVGAAAKAASLPVTLATDDALGLTLATNALQTTGNSSLAAIALSVASPAATGGLLAFSLVAAATTNATSIKGSAGQIYNLSIANNSATLAYLKVYNTATAPTPGSGTPVLRYMIPANGVTHLTFPFGVAFSTGIGITLTGLIADGDTTAVAASAYIVNIGYK